VAIEENEEDAPMIQGMPKAAPRDVARKGRA